MKNQQIKTKIKNIKLVGMPQWIGGNKFQIELHAHCVEKTSFLLFVWM